MKATERRTRMGRPSAALRRLAWGLSAGTAMLTLGACGNSVLPTGASTIPPPVPPATPSPAAVAPSVSVHGSVVDSSGRPLTDVSVYWGVGPEDYIPPSRYTNTDASGSFVLHVSGGGLEDMGGWFWVNVSEQGFGGDTKSLKVPDPSCTWDNRKCDLIANFTLRAQ